MLPFFVESKARFVLPLSVRLLRGRSLHFGESVLKA